MARVSTWGVSTSGGQRHDQSTSQRRPVSPALPNPAARVGLSAAWLTGVGAAGAVVSMRQAYPRAPHAAPGQGWPPARPVPEGRLAVAVVLGPAGRSSPMRLGRMRSSPAHRSSSYTVSASRPTAMLSGGLAVVPDHSLADVDAGLAPSRTWWWSRPWLPQTAREKQRCASGSPPGRPGSAPAGRVQWLPAAGGRGPAGWSRATAHWSAIRGLERAVPRWSGSAASAMSRTAPLPPPPG